MVEKNGSNAPDSVKNSPARSSHCEVASSVLMGEVRTASRFSHFYLSVVQFDPVTPQFLGNIVV